MIRWSLALLPWVCALELRHNSTALGSLGALGALSPPAINETKREAVQGALKLLVPRHFTHMSPHEVEEMKNLQDEMAGFFRSAQIASFVSFLMFFFFLMIASLLLHYRESRFWWQHLFSLSFWILMTIVFAGVLGAQEGGDSMSDFVRGYVIELILTMENVFVYEMILVSFRVPHRVANDMLYIVSFFQMFFQLWLFMFVAKLFQRVESLPYLMGAWLLYLGVDSLREAHDEESGFDPETSGIFRLMTSGLGERLVPHYGGGSLAVFDQKGRMQLTMMAPVTFALILVMFWLELDVTLAKIEEIPSHFIGWASSVFVAFQLPDLYFIVSEMFKYFNLLRTGISILLIFFGLALLLQSQVMIPNNVELLCMVGIIVASMILSSLMGLPPKRGQPYDTTDQESETSSTTGPAEALMYPGVSDAR